MRLLLAALILSLMAGCAAVPVAPSGVSEKQAAQADPVQQQKDDFDRLIAGSVNIIGPKNLMDMVHFTNGLTHHGMIVFHVVTTEEMAERKAIGVSKEYAEALRERVEPTLNKVEVMSVRVALKKLGDQELVVFWAVISRIMLDQPQNPEFDAFFKEIER
jgi:hypothetical protein